MKAPAPRRSNRPVSAKPRPGAAAPALATPAAVTAAPTPIKRKTSPSQFINEVRAETRKITWPTWKETWITSVMVAIMVTFTAVFFLVVDGGLSFILQQLLKLAG